MGGRQIEEGGGGKGGEERRRVGTSGTREGGSERLKEPPDKSGGGRGKWNGEERERIRGKRRALLSFCCFFPSSFSVCGDRVFFRPTNQPTNFVICYVKKEGGEREVRLSFLYPFLLLSLSAMRERKRERENERLSLEEIFSLPFLLPLLFLFEGGRSFWCQRFFSSFCSC